MPAHGASSLPGTVGPGVVESGSLSGGATGSSSKKSNSDEDDDIIRLSPTQIQKIGLTTYTAAVQELPIRIGLDGEIKENDYQTTPILSMVSGRVEDVEVQVGDKIKKGDVLTTIRSSEIARLQSNLLENMLELSADIEQAKVKYNMVKKQFERNKLLWGQGITAQSNLEMAEGEFEEARINLKNLEDKRTSALVISKERFRLFGISPEEIDRVVNQGKINDTFLIVAPCKGTLIERNVDIGQLVSSSAKLFDISDLSSVWMNAHVFEKDIRLVKKGQHASIVVDGYPDKTFEGIIDNISNVMDTKNRTLTIRATIKNDDGILRPNMFGRMYVITGKRKGLAVPDKATHRIGEKDLVFVQKSDGTFEAREIQTGILVHGMHEIKSGLKAGEKVVVTGSLEMLGMTLKRISE